MALLRGSSVRVPRPRRHGLPGARARPARRLLWAAVISGVVHALAIRGAEVDLPVAPEPLPPLAVRMETIAPAASETQRPARQNARVARTTPATPATAPAATEALPASTTPALSADPQPLPDAGPVAAAHEPIVVATAAPSMAIAAEPPLPSFPRSGRITFRLLYGRDGFPVGRTVQEWKIDGARYQIGSRSETTGIVDVFRSQHRTYLSRGELTPAGFQPETFIMSRDRGRGTEEARVRFDWTQGTITLGSATAQRAQPLPRGSQDLVSFMYQLALDPPSPGHLRVEVTNGTRFETYYLEVLAEERIDTPLGVLRTLPIRQLRAPGTEGVDLWLATEYRHLPVRIRFYGRDGEPSGEQIVSEIKLD